jgi:hypothetical protein
MQQMRKQFEVDNDEDDRLTSCRSDVEMLRE